MFPDTMSRSEKLLHMSQIGRRLPELRDCPILDIGDQFGQTGYIDFIQPSQLTEPFMKGVDCCKRPFVVFKATIYYEDGHSIETLTTFFQRYTDDNVVWMSAGHHMDLLFDTTGGANLSQMKLVEQLFYEKEIVLTNEQIERCRFLSSEKWIIDEETGKNKYIYRTPDRIKLAMMPTMR